MTHDPVPAAGAAMTPQWQLTRLMDGFLTTQLLHVAASLGVADALAGGPMTAAEIAERVGARPEPLERVLRGLAIDGVLAETGDGCFALTPLGDCLREDAPGSLRGAAMVRGELYYRAAGGMLEAMVGGRTPFEEAYGERFFEHLTSRPDREATFQASMAGRAEQEGGDVVGAYDFDGIGRLVDVGGGQGNLLTAILLAAPRMRAVLLDRPEVVARAKRRLAAEGVARRCDFVAGDFFESVPPGADAYLLSRVIHDWDDAEASQVLQTCRQAMHASSRLLLVEAIMPELAREQPAAIRMDLHMLVLLGARERTEALYRRLLEASVMRPRRVVRTGSSAGLGVIEATLAEPE